MDDNYFEVSDRTFKLSNELNVGSTIHKANNSQNNETRSFNLYQALNFPGQDSGV